ncbi:MAG: agmatine deiminase family protein [Pseudomonadota bacterium]
MASHTQIWPAEWAPHSALWAGWPRLPQEWGTAFEPAQREITAVIRTLSVHVPVRLAVGSAAAQSSSRAMLDQAADLRRIPTGDIWLRDTGPVITSAGASMQANLFDFNGWGGKYDMPGDRETASAIADEERIQARRHGFILEGGAVDGDGTGRVLTTRSCLLNTNRNAKWSISDAEIALERGLGAREVIWLDEGLMNDHTDGHIDNVARFIAPGHVVCQRASEPGDPQRARLRAVEDGLRAAGLSVTVVPAPLPVFDEDAVLPASHANFVLTNGLCLVPEFDPHTAQAACAILADLLPGRRVVSLPSRNILAGGGSFHCMTCHVPAARRGAPT